VWEIATQNDKLPKMLKSSQIAPARDPGVQGRCKTRHVVPVATELGTGSEPANPEPTATSQPPATNEPTTTLEPAIVIFDPTTTESAVSSVSR